MRWGGEADPALLRQAVEVANRLMKAQGKSDVMPSRFVDLQKGSASQQKTSLAEVGSNLLELRYVGVLRCFSPWADATV